MPIRITFNTAAARALVLAVAESLTPKAIDAIVERAAFETLTAIVEATPKRWTGQTRKSWSVRQLALGQYSIENPSQVMSWLEHGTGQSTGGYIYPRQTQGPSLPGRPIRRRMLFVPLTRAAALSDRSQFGVVGGKRRGIVVRGGVRKTGGYTGKRLVYGRDYVLAKRVKGIKPMRIVAKQRPLAQRRLLRGMVRHIQKVTNGKI